MKCFKAGIFNVLLVAAIALPIQQARSDNNAPEYTGNQLVNSCNQRNFELQNARWLNCVIYVEGVSAGTIFGTAFGYAKAIGHPVSNDIDLSVINICSPDNYTNQQAALIVSKYLQDHPTELNEPDAVLIYRALSQAWPCQKGKR